MAIELPNGKSFSMDGFLKDNSEILVSKIKKDFDFVLIVSGSGTVRVGKSVLAMQEGAFLAKRVSEVLKKPFLFDLDRNFCFNGKDLIQKATWLHENYGAGGVLIYDEAGADLQTQKIYTPVTKTLLDFFRECGQMNLFLILVIPDFFDLPKGIAISRSIALINVRFKQGLERGSFSFYNYPQKKELYVKGKKFCNYKAAKPSFYGTFYNKYPVDEQAYRKLKAQALKDNIDRILGRKRTVADKYFSEIYKQQLTGLITYLWDIGLTNDKINKIMDSKNAPKLSSLRLARIKKTYARQAPLDFEAE